MNYTAGVRPPRGLITLVHKSIPYHKIPLRTTMECTAIRVHTRKTFTICNMYISPTENLTERELTSLIQQLPPPYIIVGDQNAHNGLWGSNNTNQRGETIERIVMNTDACILNTGEDTHVHLQTNSSSCIDLCLVSSILLATHECHREDDLHGSDHFPIIVKESLTIPMSTQRRFQTKKSRLDFIQPPHRGWLWPARKPTRRRYDHLLHRHNNKCGKRKHPKIIRQNKRTPCSLVEWGLQNHARN